MAFTVKTDTPAIVDNWPYTFQYISEGSDGYNFLTPFAQEFRQIDVFIDELYEQRFIDTATNRELEKLAAEAGTTRLDNEDDPELRYRAQLRRVASASDGTAADIEGIIDVAFPDDDISNIDVQHDPGHPVIQFNVPQPYLDNIPLTQTELEQELERAFPAGHGVLVISSDTFLFGEGGTRGLGNGELI
jgi:hypothetical protein